ncbi:MAG: YfcE family phosphodiesterase [Clostridiales bacterium]|nr:YfcE family phosphodiesterase [Clostridiales bacterium]
MSTICVFSDSHGSSENMLRAIEKENPDCVFFLGDGAADIATVAKKHPQLTVYTVRGNCDAHSAAPIILRTTIEDKKFFAAHGHTFDVKNDASFWELRSAALEADAGVVLFGHTHVPFEDKSWSMEILNPGTISNIATPSYGIVRIENGTIYTELKTLNKS